MPQESWMNMQPGVTGSVPASAPAAQSQGVDPVLQEIIKNVTQPLDPDLVKSATSPVAGSHYQQVPSSLTRPVDPLQPGQLDHREVVGRGNARAQGIGNSVTAVANVIGTVATKEKQMKQDQVRDAAQKAIAAQQGIDEAKQAMEAATKSGDTATALKMQQVMQQNQQARDGIFADPKIRKALQKGFDISYTDPESNKTDEHVAVQEAIKNAKTFAEKRQAMKDLQARQNKDAGAAFGQAFEKAMPQGLAPNVQAQAQLQYQQANQKIQQAALKDYLTFKASVYRSDRTVDAARLREIGQGIMQSTRLAFQQDQQQARFRQAEKMLGIRYRQELSLIVDRGVEARKIQDEIFKDKETDPLNMYTKTRLAAETYQKNAIADGNALVALQAARMALYVNPTTGESRTPEDRDVKDIDMQIELVKGAIANDKANADNFTKQANRLVSTFGLSDGSSDSGTGTGSSGESDSVGDTEYTDPFVYLNSSPE
jgi:hypothetical protein